MQTLVKKLFSTIVLSLFFISTAFAGGILKRGSGGEPSSLDPHFAHGIWGMDIIEDMFMGLTTQNAKGGLVPGLAQSWSISTDSLTYRFNIRDAVWSDGQEITADDFVYSFKRMLDPEKSKSTSFILYSIQGARRFNKGEADDENLGISAIDKDTLEIKLEVPTPNFLGSLMQPVFYAVPKHAIEQYGREWTHPRNMVVSGPFKLKAWLPNVKIILHKNDRFFKADSVALDGVETLFIESYATQLKRWKAGELHITDGIPNGMMKTLRKKYGSQLHIKPRLSTYYYAFNTRLDKFSDQRLREAMSLAVNREMLTEKILIGGQIPTYSWVPSGMLNYPHRAELRFKNLSASQRLSRAKQLMQMAGYGRLNPLTIELSYNTNDLHKKVAIAIAAMWKAIGIRVKLINTPTKFHYQKLEQGDFEVGRAGWWAHFAYEFLELLESNHKYNYSGYNNPQYDMTMRKFSRMTNDPVMRAKVLRQAEQLLLDDHVLIPIYQEATQMLISNKVNRSADHLIRQYSYFLSLN